MRTRRLAYYVALAVPLTLLVSCGAPGSGCSGDYCGTLVFAATGTPATLLPPVTDQAIDRDIFDQIFLKLADIGPAGNTVGDEGFEHLLADRWSWPDSLTLAVHVDPRARWQDGFPVTARDVAFTFRAFTDSATDSPYRESLAKIDSVTVRDSSTALFHFHSRYPEMFYDAVYYLRILPEHLLGSVPFVQWRSAAFGRDPIGDGPYRFVSWTPGQSVQLEADSTFFLGRPHIRRLIWRLTSDLSVAVTQVVADEADAIEVLVTPANIARATAAPQLKLYPYAGSVYTIARFNLLAPGDRRRPHPILSDPDVRRALILATDRIRMAQNVFGDAAKVPPAPIPEEWTALWFPDLPVPPYDTAQANRLLTRRGWRAATPGGIRVRNGRRLALTVLLPSSSEVRRQYARLIQEELRQVGVDVAIEEVDLPTLQDRLARGTFDIAIESWANDPTPVSGIPEMWDKGGGSNFGGYSDPAFEAQVAQAAAARTPADANRAWKAAFTILAQDAPAMVLNAPDNIAAIHRRVADVRIRPDEYWAYVRTWRIPADQLIARDRVRP